MRVCGSNFHIFFCVLPILLKFCLQDVQPMPFINYDFHENWCCESPTFLTGIAFLEMPAIFIGQAWSLWKKRCNEGPSLFMCDWCSGELGAVPPSPINKALAVSEDDTKGRNMCKTNISFSNSTTCYVFLTFLIHLIYENLHMKKEFVRLCMDRPRWCSFSSVYRCLSITRNTQFSFFVWEIISTSCRSSSSQV